MSQMRVRIYLSVSYYIRINGYNRYFGVQRFWISDSSNPRHFGTIKTGLNCPDSSASVPYCLQLSHFLMQRAIKGAQTYTKIGRDHRMTQHDSKPVTLL